jgi:hypothetical protein
LTIPNRLAATVISVAPRKVAAVVSISSSISSRALVKAYWDDFAVAVVACSINRASAAI